MSEDITEYLANPATGRNWNSYLHQTVSARVPKEDTLCDNLNKRNLTFISTGTNGPPILDGVVRFLSQGDGFVTEYNFVVVSSSSMGTFIQIEPPEDELRLHIFKIQYPCPRYGLDEVKGEDVSQVGAYRGVFYDFTAYLGVQFTSTTSKRKVKRIIYQFRSDQINRQKEQLDNRDKNNREGIEVVTIILNFNKHVKVSTSDKLCGRLLNIVQGAINDAYRADDDLHKRSQDRNQEEANKQAANQQLENFKRLSLKGVLEQYISNAAYNEVDNGNISTKITVRTIKLQKQGNKRNIIRTRYGLWYGGLSDIIIPSVNWGVETDEPLTLGGSKTRKRKIQQRKRRRNNKTQRNNNRRTL
jgi:hypothetical protein